MNERIRELAEQAKFMTEEDINRQISYNTELKAFAEKFAELIILECADIAYKTSWDDLVHGYGQAVIPIHLHNTIKEHFGVER